MIIHQAVFLLLASLSAWLFCSTVFKRFTAVKIKGNMPKVGNIPTVRLCFKMFLTMQKGRTLKFGT